MAYVNLVFPSQKLNSNETLQLHTREFYAAFFFMNSFSFCRAITGANVQIERKNGKTHRKYLYRRTENFARPFITNKLFERIQILNE